jgi:hypothetical protein
MGLRPPWKKMTKNQDEVREIALIKAMMHNQAFEQTAA